MMLHYVIILKMSLRWQFTLTIIATIIFIFYQESNLYFAHSETVMPLTTLLGIFEQVPWINAESYIYAKNRDWRVSSNVPFAGNFAILVYKNEDNILVQFAVNEHLVNLPGHFHTIKIEDAIEYFEKLIQVWIDDDDKCTPNCDEYPVNKL